MKSGPIAIHFAAVLLAIAPVRAQTPVGAGEAILEEVLVVGTRRSTESTRDLAVPVDILAAEQLGGQGDMLDVLTARVPSFNVNQEPISDAATLVRPANLRGLPADSTLVLVNGKRRHRGAVIGEFVSGINKGAQGVDIVPLIPIALQRVEVLRDGASAQYGSDAIAGVINFVLEDDPEVRRLQLQYGSTYEGDGDRITAAGAFGTRLGRDGFATVSMELKDSKPTSRGSQDPQATYLVEKRLYERGRPRGDLGRAGGQKRLQGDHERRRGSGRRRTVRVRRLVRPRSGWQFLLSESEYPQWRICRR